MRSGTLPFLYLDPADVDAADETFRIRRRYPPGLESSIARSGIRAPLLVQPSRGRYRLVSGWGRWLYRPAEAPLPCFSLPEALPLESAWDAFLKDNDAFNPVEIARALRALEGVPGLSPERIVAEKLPLLGVHASFDLYRRYRRLAELGAEAQRFVEDEGLGLRRAEVLLRLPPGAVERFLSAAREIRLSLNETGEALAFIEEIASRDGVSPETVIEEARRAAESRGKEGFRRKLRELRYPEISRLERELEAARSLLDFEVPVSAEWDRTFERPGVRLSVDLASVEDLDRLEKDLRKNREAIARFFEIL